MSWIKLDDHFPTHPKIISVGGDAAWLHVCALCYAGEHLTDGRIPKALVARLSDRKNPARLAEALVTHGIWTVEGDDFLIHDYLDWNPSREQVLTTRHNKSMAGAKGAASRWHGKENAPVPVPVPEEIREVVASDSPRKRGSRIPDKFTVTSEMESWAKSQAPDVDWVMESRKFVNYWKAKPGKDAVKLDWDRTWQNWLLSAQGRTNGQGAVRTHL